MTTPTGNDPRNVGTTASSPPPDQVNQMHRYDDTDASPEAHHHTLGPDINQASPGTHNHDGRDSPILSEYSVSAHTHGALNVSFVPVGAVASVTVQDAISELDGEKAALVHTHTESQITDIGTHTHGAYALSGHTHGGGGAAAPVYVQDAAPVGPPAQYLWVQVNMGAGEDFTFWVEDGDA